MVSNVKKLIPQVIQDRWHEYKKALKEAEIEHLGNDDLSEHMDAATWGVEEAEARNKAEASKCGTASFVRALLTTTNRSRDAVSACLCRPQKFHFYPCSTSRSYPTKSSEGAEVLGMEHWETPGSQMMNSWAETKSCQSMMLQNAHELGLRLNLANEIYDVGVRTVYDGLAK